MSEASDVNRPHRETPAAVHGEGRDTYGDGTLLPREDDGLLRIGGAALPVRSALVAAKG